MGNAVKIGIEMEINVFAMKGEYRAVFYYGGKTYDFTGKTARLAKAKAQLKLDELTGGSLF